MIIYNKDILKSDCQTIAIPVNLIGIMGAGLALQFKKQYPKQFLIYKNMCNNSILTECNLTTVKIDDNKQALMFPTKRHWKNDSDILLISNGLDFILKNKTIMGIESLALPMLGCGCGKLNRKHVSKLLEEFVSKCDFKVDIYC